MCLPRPGLCFRKVGKKERRPRRPIIDIVAWMVRATGLGFGCRRLRDSPGFVSFLKTREGSYVIIQTVLFLERFVNFLISA